jgi:hypothetical protein
VTPQQPTPAAQLRDQYARIVKAGPDQRIAKQWPSVPAYLAFPCKVSCSRLRDAGAVLISEGLARAYVCSRDRCPARELWCGDDEIGRGGYAVVPLNGNNKWHAKSV